MCCCTLGTLMTRLRASSAVSPRAPTSSTYESKSRASLERRKGSCCALDTDMSEFTYYLRAEGRDDAKTNVMVKMYTPIENECMWW